MYVKEIQKYVFRLMFIAIYVHAFKIGTKPQYPYEAEDKAKPTLLKTHEAEVEAIVFKTYKAEAKAEATCITSFVKP